MARPEIKLPKQFKEILEKDNILYGHVLNVIGVYGDILQENKLYFFEEYTDHGIGHIQDVLQSAEEIITDNTFGLLTSKDISILVLSIILHDLGMHTSFSTFKCMLGGKYDQFRVEILDIKTWSELWEEYLDEAKKFSGRQLEKIFGDQNWNVTRPDLTNKNLLREGDKKLIGEFIRRHHPRIAHEIALSGIISDSGTLEFATGLDLPYKKMSGILARSHGLEIRETFKYLGKLSKDEWERPYSVNIIYLMVVLRISDYFQFDSGRISKYSLKIKTFSSPVSELEHLKHNAIEFIKPFYKDKETLHVEAIPPSSYIFLKLRELFQSIQYELDISWAVLGEVYGMEDTHNKPSIKYRRIKSNLNDVKDFSQTVKYVPERITFTADSDLSKLLIAPLYGDDPTYGIRELLQNSIDACKERNIEESKKPKSEYKGSIRASISEEVGTYYFTIEDNGRGMTLFEIKHYFLRAGASFRRNIEWQKKFVDEMGETIVQRSGRFGVGVLAAFLLGDTIYVKTKSEHDDYGYEFTAEIDSEQLEINKIELNEIGTQIKIEISQSTFEMLDNEEAFDKDIFRTTSFRESKYVFWTKWFTLQEPEVIFSTPHFPSWRAYNEYNPSYRDNIGNWNCLDVEGYNKVLWTYSLDSLPITLTCNGIIIPNGYDLEYEYHEKEYGLNINTPNISVFDNNANLNLNLNRNSLLFSKLPFEKDLYEDIFKDLIAYILCFKSKVKFSNYIEYEFEKLLHPSISNVSKLNDSFSAYSTVDLLYNSNGFALDVPYFTTQLMRNGIERKISCYSFNEKSVSVPCINEDEIVNFDFTLSGNIGELSHTLERSGRMLLKKHYYDTMFKSSVKRISKTLKSQHRKEFSNDEWVIYTHYDYKGKYVNLDTLKQFKNIDLVVDKNLKTADESDTVFWEMLDFYFKKDVIIPYNFSERKKKFSFAFNKLSKYIKKYQS